VRHFSYRTKSDKVRFIFCNYRHRSTSRRFSTPNTKVHN